MVGRSHARPTKRLGSPATTPETLTARSGASRSRPWPSSWPAPSRVARPGAALCWEGWAGPAGGAQSGWEVAPPPSAREAEEETWASWARRRA